MAEKYVGYRHPKEVIKYAVWLYYRFNASLRDTVEGLFYRRLDVSHETVRQSLSKQSGGYTFVNYITYG